jgi:lactoylglutathione lyase
MNDIAAPAASRGMRIAAASSDGTRIDQHFGQAQQFYVYDVGSEGVFLVARRTVAEHAKDNEGPRETVCRMLADCNMLLVSKIGINPQSMLAAAGIEASNLYAEKNIAESLRAIFAEKRGAAEAPLDCGKFRLAHVMLRVADIDRAIAFYAGQLGMRVLERREHQKNQFTQAYLGYGDDRGMIIELVFNWMRDTPYEAGESYGHIAIEVDGIVALCNRLSAAGVPLPRLPRSQRHRNNIVAFAEDPDGHRIELIQPGEETDASISAGT